MELIYITLAVYGMGAATALFPKKMEMAAHYCAVLAAVTISRMFSRRMSAFPRGSTAKNPGCPSTLTCAPTDPKEKREHARRRAPLFRTFYKDSPYLSKMRLKIKALQ